MRCSARGGEDRFWIVSQKFEPGVDVAAIPQFTLHADLGALKCRRKLGDKFIRGVRVRAKAGRKFPLETGLMSSPVSELMQDGRVVALHALERGGRRECGVVLGRNLS